MKTKTKLKLENNWKTKTKNKSKRKSHRRQQRRGYLTQVITHEEAERRGKTYDANGMTYLLDLDYHEKEALFTVDASVYGNISRFVNHSVRFLKRFCFAIFCKSDRASSIIICLPSLYAG